MGRCLSQATMDSALQQAAMLACDGLWQATLASYDGRLRWKAKMAGFDGRPPWQAARAGTRLRWKAAMNKKGPRVAGHDMVP